MMSAFQKLSSALERVTSFAELDRWIEKYRATPLEHEEQWRLAGRAGARFLILRNAGVEQSIPAVVVFDTDKDTVRLEAA